MTIWTFRRFTLTCGVLAAFAAAVAAPLAQEHAAPHWSYGGIDGPDHWSELDKTFSTCQLGRHQSPIDIRGAKAADLPPIQFAYQRAPLHIVNNGHTIQVNYAPGSFITVARRRADRCHGTAAAGPQVLHV
jgi:carbonic anhydrase